MKKIVSLFTTLLVVAFTFTAQAEDKKTTAENLVKAAIAHYKEAGQEKAFADFSVKGGEFNHGEFYVFIQSVASNELVYHGANVKLIGKNLMALKDPTGKEFVKEFTVNTKANGTAWTEYQWVPPETKKIAPKVAYSELYNDLIFVVGYYK
ncbi:cache domain-containing protein [uncultured Kiloniella sp.]|uniref:cache domain-containing protein n=1 Tax=uncultured Kiloniella sp. TaxID=1133091 RepID=UPI00260D70C1|nr:cache domain-containing protein [uncultured Kiloniella sp.]